MAMPEALSEPTRRLITNIADRLKDEPGAQAILLTGPHAMGIERQADKLYFIVITDDAEGVIEHRFIKNYNDIEQEMEVGMFPTTFIDMLASRGYWDMVSYRAVEALRAAATLIDPSGYGEGSIAAMARHLPRRQFVSGQIHKMVATYDDAMSLYSKGDYEGAVLVTREALRLAVDLVTKTSAGDPEETADQTIRHNLGEAGYRDLLRALDAEGMDANTLSKRLQDTLDKGMEILRQAGIPDDFLRE
jgi:hypothetical protein